MTFNDDADLSAGRVSKRGRNGAIIGGGGGLVVVALVIVSQLTGVDLTGLAPLLGGEQSSESSSSEEALSCTAEEANTQDDCRVLGATASLETYWTDIAPALGFTYTSPSPTVVFEGATTTGCGNATSAVGPFYCPADQTIYLDVSFYDELRSRFDASGGSLAQMYIIGHEWGHHVQSIAGINNSELDLRDSGPDSDSVRLELQADCFAGAWIGDAATTVDDNGVTFLDPVTEQEIADALNAAASVGDDHIQEATAGRVDPEGWTHGSSEQRQRWFMIGYNGTPGSCSTFEASASEL